MEFVGDPSRSLSMQALFQAALFRRARTLAFDVVSRPTMLSAILRNSARLRAAVRSRTRLSSSRVEPSGSPENVTSSTRCSAFSTAQCERIAWPSGEPFGFPRDGQTVGAAQQKAADFSLDLGGRAVEAADAFHREHGAQARPAAQNIQNDRLRAGEHPAPHQAAMRVVERAAIGPAGCANAEAALAEMFHHSRVCQRVVALEGQKVVAPACQDALGNRSLAPPWRPE